MAGKKESDDQLAIAMFLRIKDELRNRNPTNESELPEIAFDELDAVQIEEFQLAERCLELLNSAESQTRDAVTLGETIAVDDGDDTAIENVPSMEFPTRMGRFEILRELGRGGFGVVFLAVDPKLEREVALKIPKPHAMLDETSRMRLNREARSAAILSHPAIVPIFETGNVGPIHYIAFEYCPGVTLADWIAKREVPCPTQLAAGIIARLAEAVQHAHSRGVIHRDLKPGNILVQTTGKDSSQSDAGMIAKSLLHIDDQQALDSLRIADFGLAKIDSADESNQLSHSRSIIGTPAYMSPEQARGDSLSLGPAVDIYALGAILYELLTGRPPFKESSNVATLHAIINTPPRSPRRLDKRVPGDLSEICLKCLRKDPAERYVTAMELADDLQKFIDGRPVAVRPLSTISRMWRWSRRNPVVASLTAMFLISVVVGAGLVTWQWRAAQHNLDRALIENDRAQRNVERVERAINEMVTGLSDRLHYLPQMQAFRQRMLSEAIELQQQLFDDAELNDAETRLSAARTKLKIAGLQKSLGDTEAATNTLNDMMQHLESSFANPIDTQKKLELQSNAMLVLGRIAINKHQFEKAIEFADGAIDGFSKLTGSDDSFEIVVQLAAARHLKGETLDYQNRRGDAETEFVKAMEILDALPDQYDKEIKVLKQKAISTNSLAVILKGTGRTTEAERRYRDAIEIGEQIIEIAPDVSSHYSQKAVYHINLGNLFAAQREYALANPEYQIAVKLLSSLVREYPNVPEFLDYLAAASIGNGLSQFRLGNLNIARASLEMSIDTSKKLGNITNESDKSLTLMGSALTNLAKVLRAEGQLDSALVALERAHVIKRRLIKKYPRMPQYHHGCAITCSNLGKLFDALSDHESAFAAYQEGLDCAEVAMELQPGNPAFRRMVIWFCQQQMFTLCRLNRNDQALEMVSKIHNLDGKNPTTLLKTIGELARCIDWISEQERDNPDVEQSVDVLSQYRSAAIELLGQVHKLDAEAAAKFRKTATYQLLND